MTPSHAPSPPRIDPADSVRGRLMQASLMALLDKVPGSRDALPHLAALERALGEKGAAAIAAIPERWRARICAQLSSLPLPDQDGPLADLQQRLLATMAPPPAPAPRPPAARLVPTDAPAFDAERTMVVTEISHSEFMAAAAASGAEPGAFGR